MSSLKICDRFQLEASKLGRTIVFQVTVFERKDRGKTRLFAETECSDALQHLIQFVIRDAPDVDGVVDRFECDRHAVIFGHSISYDWTE